METATERAVALQMLNVDVGALRYPETAVLKEVNWTVREGEYWALGGLQGSGKSDLLFTAAGLVPPIKGVYRVFGKEIGPGYEKELLQARLLVGLVFDGGRMLNHLTIGQNVVLPLEYHHNVAADECDERSASLLELVEMGEYTSRMPGTINRNLQQRAGLARALGLKPKVLLLDNPLSGLDPRDAFWWLNFLDKLAEGHPVVDGQPMTLVVTGDDLRPWRNRAQQFAALSNRKFISLGGREELGRHEDPVLQELLRR